MITKHVFRGLGAACVLTGACGLLAAPAGADAVSDFYRGKDIALIISTGPGGGMDQTARIVGRHWTKYLPGHPTFVAKNMPGAGHLRATNYLYNQAPKDGTAIASIIPSFVHHQLIGGKGTHYDAAKFEWLGSAITSNASFYVWHTSGVKTLQDAMKKIIIMGGTGAGSFTVLYPTILNNVLGTKFKIVMGYRHTGQVNLAMERGEVQGRAGNSFNTLMANNPQWVKEGKINILLQVGQTKERGFENVPLLTEFAKDEKSREVLQVFCDYIALGRPFLAPPGTPADRVAALRTSFDETMKDPTLRTDAKKSRLDIVPTTGIFLQKLAEHIIATKSDVRERVKAALTRRGTVDCKQFTDPKYCRSKKKKKKKKS